jgi:kynureninase
VAELIGASGREIIFTSCATESNNAAIQAALKANPGKRHIVTSAVEHSSVLNYCRPLEGRSAAVSSSTSRSTLQLSNAPTDATRCVRPEPTHVGCYGFPPTFQNSRAMPVLCSLPRLHNAASAFLNF